MTKKEANVAITAIILLGVVIGILIWRDIIFVGDALQIVILFFLALATLGYAKRTQDMAREMREQRVTVSRPILIIRAVPEGEIWEGSTSDKFSHFEISNTVSTPAVEVEILLMTSRNAKDAPQRIQQTYLRAVDPPIKFSPCGMYSLEESMVYYLAAEYQSILPKEQEGKLFQTWLPFRIKKSVAEDTVILVTGELEYKKITSADRIDAFNSRSKPK